MVWKSVKSRAMRFYIERTSNSGTPRRPIPVEGAVLVDGEWEIQVETLEDLMRISRISGGAQLILIPAGTKDLPQIEIYDGYRE